MSKYKLALIGYPLDHSLSPVLYKAAFKDLDLDGSYEVLPTRPEDLVSRIKHLRAEKYYGFNVTIPHKVPTTLFLSRYDENVNIMGSVNTVKIENDTNLTGYNTDVFGFMEAIDKSINLEDKKAVILGTGGAARAVCAGLYKLGVREVTFCTRNIINSAETLELLRGKFTDMKISVLQNSLIDTFEDVSILVNTTPVGMKKFDEDTCPLKDKTIDSLREDAIVYDIVYNPYETALISKARKFNRKYICGLDMLVYQACRAVEIWTGKMPDFKSMKIAALESYLLK